MNIQDVERFRPFLEALIARHADRDVSLLIVADIAHWSLEHCRNATDNPIAMAVVDSASQGWGIVVRRSMDDHQIKGVLDRISFVGTYRAHDLLNTVERFLRHTVLHELAHLTNNWDQSREDDCDSWAFERLESP